jgi:hypothetical protein
MSKLLLRFIPVLIVMAWSFVSASELVGSTPETVAGATTVDAAQAKALFDQEVLNCTEY